MLTCPIPPRLAWKLPVYRRENGLWAHQKAFIKRAFEAHQSGGARFVLADQVGLGKTVQLGLAAKLMALIGDKPILILTPRPLMEQWQGELLSLLDFPSARWNGRQWIDENGIAYPDYGPEGLRRCPRRAGIVSTGLIKRRSEGIAILESLSYECVILDEAHHARRQNLGPAHRTEPPKPTNLMRFLQTISRRTRSLLLATAKPVQLDPIEAWDLLAALSERTIPCGATGSACGGAIPGARRSGRARLEQRKGRIQRIGQLRDTVDIYNMRYLDAQCQQEVLLKGWTNGA